MTGELLRNIFLAGLVVAGICLYIILTSSMENGRKWWAVLAIWVSSPIAILSVGVIMEHRRVLDMVNPATQSWAALFSDVGPLPAAAAIAAAGISYTRFRAYRWESPHPCVKVVCGLAGVLAGILFHRYDAPHYTELARNSPGMLTHDFLAFPVIFGGLLYGLWLLWRSRYARRRHLPAMLMVIIMGFGGPATADNTFHHLDGRNMHVQLDWDTGKVIPYPNLK